MLTLNQSNLSEPITEESFLALVSQWNRETELTSSLTEIIDHPAFRRIVNSGREAIPFLLRELKKKPCLLAVALREITGEDRVPRNARGKVEEMAKAWLA
jgi:hypothetical protein